MGNNYKVDRMSPKDYGWSKCDLNNTAWSAAVDSMVRSKRLIASSHDFQHKFLLPTIIGSENLLQLKLGIKDLIVF